MQTASIWHQLIQASVRESPLPSLQTNSSLLGSVAEGCALSVCGLTYFGVSVQLIFHLQTCNPPVLPPLHELFQDSCSAISSRPIHMGKDIDWHKLEVSLPDAMSLGRLLVCLSSAEA